MKIEIDEELAEMRKLREGIGTDQDGGRVFVAGCWAKEALLIILRRERPTMDGNPKYFCLRYFEFAGYWKVSADLRYVSGDVALAWLADGAGTAVAS